MLFVVCYTIVLPTPSSSPLCCRVFDGLEKKVCSVPDDFPGAWRATAALVSIGIVLLLLAFAATLWSYIDAKKLQLARWMGAIAAVVYSLASLIYPTGFKGEPVGGRAYKLPENAAIGFSYVPPCLPVPTPCWCDHNRGFLY
jgi:hypothetical protein